MGKPSIFSRDYERKMKKRKRIVVVTIIAVVLLLVGVTFNSGIKSFLSRNVSALGKVFSAKNKKVEEPKKVVDNTPTNKPEAKVDKPKQTEELGYDIQLSDGNVKAIYEVTDNDKKFKYVAPIEKNIYYDISPSEKAMIIFDSKAQKMIYVDINGVATDVTSPAYISTSNESYPQNQVLARNANFIWCTSPKFIDEDNLAYISQLPWLDSRPNRYVWVSNIKSKTHVNLTAIDGQNITLGGRIDKGLTVTIDGKVKYLNANMQLVD